jgi:hypothetical protein
MQVTTSIPLPAARMSYPFAGMEIGGSFLAAGKTAQQLSPVIAHHQRKNGHRYTCRTVDDGVRVWRTA